LLTFNIFESSFVVLALCGEMDLTYSLYASNTESIMKYLVFGLLKVVCTRFAKITRPF